MKGDFSRCRFDPARHYSAVLEQQGRVQLDADANEQRAIDAHRLATETVDVIGATGAPIHDAGFAISLRPDNRSLLIGLGRYYVDGLLCEAATQLDYTQQPWLIDPQPGIDVMLAALRVGRASAVRVWLETWQRLVTPIDDPCIKDPALGEADTTVRVQTVWRVVADAPAPPATDVSGVRQAVDTLRQSLASYQEATRSTALQAIATHADTLATEIARSDTSFAQLAPSLLSLHSAGAAALPGLARAPGDTGARLAAALDTIGRIGGVLQHESCCVAMRRRPLALLPGMMTASTDDTSGQGPCLPSPQAAYRGLENQLYRVEVHRGGPLANATFKWSRDNGSVLTRIVHVSGAVLTVDSLGPDANLGFAPLQWVEISDDSDAFGPTPNQPGQLRQIKFVDFEHRRITLTQPAPAVDTDNGHAKLRRWDHTDAAATEAGIAMSPGGWHSLENGIRVQFSEARPFVAGDFWLIPARTATGALEWPPCGGDGADCQPARNTRIHRAPLACIDWEPNCGGFVPHDCRDLFFPLTELTPPAAQAALHVTEVHWQNDDIMTLDQLLATGLSVALDGPPAAGIDAANFIVIIESPIASAFQRDVAGVAAVGGIFRPSGVLRGELIVDGAVAVNGNAIAWTVPSNLVGALWELTELLDLLADEKVYPRVRVSLKGRTIRGSNGQATLFLDGQCFGEASLRADGRTPRTDLALPSGDVAKASDFESWFYLAPIPRVATLTVTPAAVAWVEMPGTTTLKLVDNTSGKGNPSQPAVTPVLALALNYDAVAATTVGLSVAGGTLGIVGLPTSVTVPRGATAPAQTINVTVGNPGPVTQNFTITATVTLAGGYPFSTNTNFAVTGIAGQGGISAGGTPINPNLLSDLVRITPGAAGPSPTGGHG